VSAPDVEAVRAAMLSHWANLTAVEREVIAVLVTLVGYGEQEVFDSSDPNMCMARALLHRLCGCDPDNPGMGALTYQSIVVDSDEHQSLWLSARSLKYAREYAALTARVGEPDPYWDRFEIADRESRILSEKPPQRSAHIRRYWPAPYDRRAGLDE